MRSLILQLVLILFVYASVSGQSYYPEFYNNHFDYPVKQFMPNATNEWPLFESVYTNFNIQNNSEDSVEKKVYFYNVDSQLTRIDTYKWDTVSNSWKPYTRYDWYPFYGARYDTTIWSAWSESLMDYRVINKHEWFYGVANRIDSTNQYSADSTGSLFNFEKILYFYSSSTDMDSMLIFATDTASQLQIVQKCHRYTSVNSPDTVVDVWMGNYIPISMYYYSFITGLDTSAVTTILLDSNDNFIQSEIVSYSSLWCGINTSCPIHYSIANYSENNRCDSIKLYSLNYFIYPYMPAGTPILEQSNFFEYDSLSNLLKYYLYNHYYILDSSGFNYIQSNDIDRVDEYYGYLDSGKYQVYIVKQDSGYGLLPSLKIFRTYDANLMLIDTTTYHYSHIDLNDSTIQIKRTFEYWPWGDLRSFSDSLHPNITGNQKQQGQTAYGIYQDTLLIDTLWSDHFYDTQLWYNKLSVFTRCLNGLPLSLKTYSGTLQPIGTYSYFPYFSSYYYRYYDLDSSCYFTIGLAEHTQASVSIYPNPTVDQIRIELIDNNMSCTQTVVILDLTGSVVQQHVFTGNYTTLDIGGLPAGLYLVNFKELNLTQRIVKL